MKVFTAEQMRAFDKAATEEYSIPSIVLMENAALRVVEFLELKFAPLREKRIVILCGKGNNGGDGFAIARHLEHKCYNLSVIMVSTLNELKGDALLSYQMLMASKDPEGHVMGPPAVYELSEGKAIRDQIRDFPTSRDILVDALLGTGFQGEIRDQRISEVSGLLWEPDEYSLRRKRSKAHTPPARIAVDLPSTLNADTGEAPLLSPHFPRKVSVDYTISFAAPKRGMFLRDGIKACGEIWIAEIGTRAELMEFTDTNCRCITREAANSMLSIRPLDAHKGDAGRAVICGGSYGMSGAPTLAAKAVLRAGAGLCIVCLPDRVLPMFAAAFSEATSHPLKCDEEGQLVADAANAMPEHWKNANVVALGPGLSRAPGALDFARRIVRECPHPLIIDADALYALRTIEEDVRKREGPTILTPHPGEMGELMEIETSAVQEDRVGTAQACAAKFNAIVVLKGARSIVTCPDGQIYFNLTGNSGMATGGSGDVLTGTIAGLLAQLRAVKSPGHATAEHATLLGVYLHGLAGDIAHSERGNGLIAGDIAEALPIALKQIEEYCPPANTRLMRLE